MDPPSVTLLASFSVSTELTSSRRFARSGGRGPKVGATGMELHPAIKAKAKQNARFTRDGRCRADNLSMADATNLLMIHPCRA